MISTTWRGINPQQNRLSSGRLRLGIRATSKRLPPTRCYLFFDSVVIDEDNGRRWRIRIARPCVQPPSRGFPSLWMLDGNRALTHFDTVLLCRLSQLPAPPVLVFIDADHDLLIDLPTRARDYTFQPADHPFLKAPDAPDGLVGGGAQALLNALLLKAMPAITHHVRLDHSRQALWGHSLAGLFVLHALYAGDGLFTDFATASPSLWWGQGALLGTPEEHFIAGGSHYPARIWIFLGGAERAGQIDPRSRERPDHTDLLTAIQGAPADAALHLARRLATLPGLAVRYREFPALHHAAMFHASLRAVLQHIVGLPSRGPRNRGL